MASDRSYAAELQRFKELIQEIPIESINQFMRIIESVKDLKEIDSTVQPLETSHHSSNLEGLQEPENLENSELVDALTISVQVLRRLMLPDCFTSCLFHANTNVMNELLTVSPKLYDSVPSDCQDLVIEIIKSISALDESSKAMVGENPDAISVLIKALKQGDMDSNIPTLAAIKMVSTVPSNLRNLCEFGMVEALVHVIEENRAAEGEVIEVLEKLSEIEECRVRLLNIILHRIRDQNFVGRILPVLHKLSVYELTRREMVNSGAIPTLITIIKESAVASQREIACKVLHLILLSDEGTSTEIRSEESVTGALAELSSDEGNQTGSTTARAILDILSIL